MGNLFSTSSILTGVERIKYEIIRAYICKVKPDMERVCNNDEQIIEHILEIDEYLEQVYNTDDIEEKNKLLRYLDSHRIKFNNIETNPTDVKTDAWGYEF